jgi:hypothetical protein
MERRLKLAFLMQRVVEELLKIQFVNFDAGEIYCAR